VQDLEGILLVLKKRQETKGIEEDLKQFRGRERKDYMDDLEAKLREWENKRPHKSGDAPANLKMLHVAAAQDVLKIEVALNSLADTGNAGKFKNKYLELEQLAGLQDAFMSGKIKIQGDMGLAMKLQQIL
jgi:hypothetical protein